MFAVASAVCCRRPLRPVVAAGSAVVNTLTRAQARSAPALATTSRFYSAVASDPVAPPAAPAKSAKSAAPAAPVPSPAPAAPPVPPVHASPPSPASTMPPITMNPPAFSLAGKLVLVTGAAQGLGLAMSQAIVASGADLAMVDLNKSEAEVQAKIMVDAFRTEHPGLRTPIVTAHQADVADEASVDACVAEVVEAHTAARAAAAPESSPPPPPAIINGLVTSAGFCQNFPAVDYPPARMRALWAVNVDGTYLFATAVARHLAAVAGQAGQPAGQAASATASDLSVAAAASHVPASMVFIGSMSGSIVNVPQPQAPYNASKAAVRHLAASFAVEWAPAAIRVNCLSPGYMQTALTQKILADQPALRQQWTAAVPQGRLGVPSDLTGPVVFLLSDAAKYVTGAELRVDGGYTLL